MFLIRRAFSVVALMTATEAIKVEEDLSDMNPLLEWDATYTMDDFITESMDVQYDEEDYAHLNMMLSEFAESMTQLQESARQSSSNPKNKNAGTSDPLGIVYDHTKKFYPFEYCFHTAKTPDGFTLRLVHIVKRGEDPRGKVDRPPLLI